MEVTPTDSVLTGERATIPVRNSVRDLEIDGVGNTVGEEDGDGCGTTIITGDNAVNGGQRPGSVKRSCGFPDVTVADVMFIRNTTTPSTVLLKDSPALIKESLSTTAFTINSLSGTMTAVVTLTVTLKYSLRRATGGPEAEME